MRLIKSEGTDIFRSGTHGDEQGIRVWLAGLIPAAVVRVRVDGGEPAEAEVDISGNAQVLAFALQPATPSTPSREVTLSFRSGRSVLEARQDVRYGEPGWTLHLVPHFHFDPVWWNTQAAFMSEWEALPVATETRMLPDQRTAFELMAAHLDRARTDPDYCFVVAELDYLKPWWDTFPEHRDDFRRLVREGRIDVVGGSYNEPSTTLVSAESTFRNVISGMGFQRTVLGADPSVSWMLDVFGHDPHYPAVMAAAGMRGSSWARGPFHENGPMIGGAVMPDRDPLMQFTSEFEWMAPNGAGLLTSYLTPHYSSGWWMHVVPTLAEAEAQTYELFRRLKKVAATKHVLLLVGADHIMPNRWVTDIHRHWAEQYTWPRFVVTTPSRFFQEVEADLARGRGIVTTQTRDMNPIFAGTAVSYIDTKQANRAIEVTLLEAEKFAALAWSRGLATGYPAAEIDHAWRQLSFGAHHDAITGSESDQVYIDLLGVWRTAWSTARALHRDARRALLSRRDLTGESRSVTVFNGISADRVDVVRVALDRRPDGVVDAAGAAVPSVLSGDDESGWVLDIVAPVPATGYATFRVDEPAVPAERWTDVDGLSASNEYFALRVDAARGGTVTSFRDLASGVELITAGGAGNEIVIVDEYPDHPVSGYGPWFVSPTGSRRARSSQAEVVSVHAQRSPAGERVVVSGRLDGMSFRQTLTLWRGVARVDAVTHLDFTGSDQLVRIAWPCAVSGATPVAQTGGAVIGRNVAHPDADSATFPWGMESTCHEWFGLSAPMRLRVTDPDRAAEVSERAFAVAEIVSRDLAESAESGRLLAQALVRRGVTSTNSLADGIRYGDLDNDSNQPDLRIAFGTPETSTFVAEVLAGADPALADEVARRAGEGYGAVLVPARPAHDTTAPGASMAGALDLPVLILTGDVEAAVAAIVDDLGDGIVDVVQGLGGLPWAPFDDRSVALLNRGLPGYAVDPAGTLSLSVVRSCTGWPSGVWIDPPTRTTPDGSGFQLQHWSHAFEYALAAGAGDWRSAAIAERALAFGHPLTALVESGMPAPQDASASLLRVEPSSVQVGAVKRGGNPLAFPGDAGLAGGLTLRLRETHGDDTTAVLDFGDVVPDGIHRTDLLERAVGEEFSSEPRIEIPVGGFDTAHVNARFADERTGYAPAASGVTEFSRYWLHNTGPAPLGNHPVSVRIHERGRVDDGAIAVEVQVSSELPGRGTGGRIRWELSGGGRLRGPREIAVPPFGESHVVPLTIDLDGEAGGEPIAVVATFIDGRGAAVYDAAAFDTAGARLPAADVAGAIAVTWSGDAYEVRPGGTSEISVQIHNSNPFDLRGDLLLITPWGTWDWIDEWTSVIDVPAGERLTRSFLLSPPAGSAASATWALVKIGALGTVTYSEAVPIVIAPGS